MAEVAALEVEAEVEALWEAVDGVVVVRLRISKWLTHQIWSLL